MTVFYKSMLAAACEIVRGEDDPALCNVLLEPDGSVAAVSRWAIFAASPSVGMKLPFDDVALPSAIAVPVKQLVDLCKAIPADRQFKGQLEHTSITHAKGNMHHATYHDGRGERRVTLRSVQPIEALASWRARFRALGPAGSGRRVFNRKRLEAVVSAISTACRHDGTFEYVDQTPFEHGYTWRAFNAMTGQIIIVSWILPAVGMIHERIAWEKEVFGETKLSRAVKQIAPSVARVVNASRVALRRPK